MEWFKLVSLLALLPAVLSALPNDWKACSRSATDYTTCLRDAVVAAVASLVNGDKRLGVLPLDPLRVNSVEIPKHDGPVSVSWSLQEVDVFGIKDFTLDISHNDWKTMKGVAHIPDLSVVGNYKIDGQVLVLPIKGEGKCNITLDGLDMDIDAKWMDSEIDGKQYFTMEKLILNMKPKTVFIQFDNLFNGNKALGDNMNKFLNENWRQIYDELKPPITETISKVLSQIANRVLHKIPAEEIDLK